MCTCPPFDACPGHDAWHPLPLAVAAPELARLYLRDLATFPSQAIVDPADMAAWIGGDVDPAALVAPLAAALASWHAEECSDCPRPEDYYHDETPPQCRTCVGSGWVELPCPRIVCGNGLACVRCLRAVGEHDGVCRHCGAELILETSGISLERALKISTCRESANDMEAA